MLGGPETEEDGMELADGWVCLQDQAAHTRYLWHQPSGELWVAVTTDTDQNMSCPPLDVQQPLSTVAGLCFWNVATGAATLAHPAQRRQQLLVRTAADVTAAGAAVAEAARPSEHHMLGTSL